MAEDVANVQLLHMGSQLRHRGQPLCAGSRYSPQRINLPRPPVQMGGLPVFEKLHALPVHEVEERKRVYQGEVASSPTFRELKEAFDTWCAVWFWLGDSLDLAPYPTNFLKPPDQRREIVGLLARRHHFFHWELEFPDVFTGPESGFSAVIGNPPWEIQKPNSKEFFSNVDPMYPRNQ